MPLPLEHQALMLDRRDQLPLFIDHQQIHIESSILQPVHRPPVQNPLFLARRVLHEVKRQGHARDVELD